MANRISYYSPDAVSALNLVEVDFYKRKAVIHAWKIYMQHLGQAAPSEGDQLSVFVNKGLRLRTQLLHQIALSLGYKFEQMELFDGGYYPSGAAKVDADQDAIRRLLADIAAGEKSFPISLERR